jgi:hypothetical protein
MYEPVKQIEEEIRKMELQIERLKQDVALEQNERLTRIGNLTKGVNQRQRILQDVKFTVLVLESHTKFMQEVLTTMGATDGRVPVALFRKMKQFAIPLQEQYDKFYSQE